MFFQISLVSLTSFIHLLREPDFGYTDFCLMFSVLVLLISVLIIFSPPTLRFFPLYI